MSLRALVYAYILGGVTFIPLLILAAIAFTIYTAVPVPVPVPVTPKPTDKTVEPELNDTPRTRKGWLTVRHTFEDTPGDGSYVTLVKSYLDARSKDPKRARPKDTWYVVLKGKVLYLYEDEAMTECDAAVELGSYDVVIHPEGLLDGELFTRRNAICLKPRTVSADSEQANDCEPIQQDDPWFIFVRSCVDMEDWYLTLVHASHHPSGTPTLTPLRPVFLPSEMNTLVTTLDEQPDVIPMRWFNALLGRCFYTFYRTQMLESYIIGRLMKKLSKVKRPAFLTDIAVTQFSVGNRAPTLSKPMLKELTKEGDASLEVGFLYKGEIRATVEATAVINLGARFKSYTVKLVLAVVVRELEGNLLIKVKRPPSSRIWYAFTKPPRMVIHVEPIVSDRQITWSMILNTIEAKIEEVIIDSVVLPNMDDISFFDSSGYEHRGGVWADAVRLDKPMTEPTPEPTTKPFTPTVSSQPSEETGPSTHGCTRSEEEPATETPSLESVSIIHSPTLSTEKALTTTTRRRSWFYPGADVEPDSEQAKEVEEEVRGTKEFIEPDDSLGIPPEISMTQPLDASDNDQDVQNMSPRSSSTHSHTRSSRAHSISSSIGGDESSNYFSDTSATFKNPRHSLGASTAGSFLSTLKSKAGDKQALSNTAKEAMRKWGVNWGLKRESGGNPSPDDLADVGPSDYRPRTESTHGRQSYADMRAAVMERREREQLDRDNRSTSPIPVPQHGGKTERSQSVSGGRITAHSSGSTSPGLSRSFGDVNGDPFKDRDEAEENSAPSFIQTQPSQARTMTIPGIHASHKGEVMSMGNVAPVAPVAETKPKGATIQSMYRLWKSPNLTGQQSQETSSRDGDTGDGNHDVVPLSLAPEVPCPPRVVPPPLPPRTISSVAVRHATEGPDEFLAVPLVSAASEALKSIATRDETRRSSVEVNRPVEEESTLPVEVTATRPDSKPPLPPRRVVS